MFGRGFLFWTCLCLGCFISQGCSGDPVDPLPEEGANDLETSRLPLVEDFEPASAIQGSVLTMHVHGQNFDEGSRVDLLLSGNVIEEVQTISTRLVTPEELVADISIADNAPVAAYEVQVTTSGGKRGIPIEDFEVLADSLRAGELVFTTEPGPALSGLFFSTRIQVTAKTADGQTDTRFAGTVSIALLENPNGAGLVGTSSARAVRGVATFFGDLRIHEPARGYTLTARATGLKSATSASFDVRPAGRIAFVSDREGGTPKIYVMNADGSGVTRLTYGPERDSRPAWSPDGRRIAFARGADLDPQLQGNPATCGIHVINADGSGLTRLTTACGDGEPTWSPDGTWIAFRKWTGTWLPSANGLYVMKADGSGVLRLTESTFDFYPAWSPDGRRIAFNRDVGNEEWPQQVYVMDADGSDIHRLTFDNGHGPNFAESMPAWSPDGSSIVFWSFGYGIATISSDGGFPTGVYKGVSGLFSSGYVHFFSNPDWSPDGRKVVFAGEPDPSSFGGRKLVITDASGAGSLQPLTDVFGPGEDYEPAWSRVSP